MAWRLGEAHGLNPSAHAVPRGLGGFKKMIRPERFCGSIYIDRAVDVDIDIQKVADPPWGSITYSIGVLESRIGGSFFWILPCTSRMLVRCRRSERRV